MLSQCYCFNKRVCLYLLVSSENVVISLTLFSVGNLCFYGECSYYCDSRHSFCGKVDVIEGSLMVWLPESPQGDRDRWKSPYRRYIH